MCFRRPSPPPLPEPEPVDSPVEQTAQQVVVGEKRKQLKSPLRKKVESHQPQVEEDSVLDHYKYLY